MWLYFLLLILGFQTSSVILQNDEMTLFKQRCQRNAGDDGFAELQGAFYKAYECVGVLQTARTDLPNLYVLFCVDTPKVVYTCLSPLIDKLEACLNPEERYVHDFIYTGLNATFENFCKEDGKALKEHLTAIMQAQCFETIQSTKQRATEKCFTEFSIEKNISNPNFVLTKSLYCNDVRKSTECLYGVLKEECSNNALAEFAKSFYQPYLEWCDKNTSAHSTGFVCVPFSFLFVLPYVQMLI